MSIYFLDSSALVKHYIKENGSEWVSELCANTDAVIYIARIAAVEVSSAMVRRGYSAGLDMNPSLELLDHHFNDTFVRISITDTLIENAVQMVRKYRLRGYDAVQLAAALTLMQEDAKPIFVCSDYELNKAAQAEGMDIVNPNDRA